MDHNQSNAFRPDPTTITIKHANATLQLTATSDLDDLEHAALLVSSGDIKLSPVDRTLLSGWIVRARRHHISIVDGSTHLILNLFQLPLPLLRELEANVLHYAISQHDLPSLQSHIALMEKDAPKLPIPCTITREFYRYLLATTPASNLPFVTRFCAQHALGRRSAPPRMSPDTRARRLSTLANVSNNHPNEFLLAADHNSIYIIRPTDGPLIHRWYHHLSTHHEITLLPHHADTLLRWLNKSLGSNNGLRRAGVTRSNAP